MSDYKTIAESNNFIVLDKYVKECRFNESYQSEYDLEREFIQDLQNQGYDYVPELNTPEKLLANVRDVLQALNNVQFADGEWRRFVETWLDKPSDGIVEKTRKIHDDYVHDFVFDDGHIQNIYLLDKKNIARNRVQVIRQFEQTGSHANRYDVTILVNGLPLVQVELKKRGVAIREAFNQVHRYSKESFNSTHSLFKYLQLFVISNGTDSRYFANTTQRNKNSFDFTMNWAKADNTLIRDLKDFTATFFQKKSLLNVLLHYSVFDTSNTLLVMRPYQIAATERILWKINCAWQAEKLEQYRKRRLYLAHHRLRQDPDQFQGGTAGHRAGFHRQGVFRGRPQGSGLPDHEGIPAFFAGQRQWLGQHCRPQAQPGQGRQPRSSSPPSRSSTT